MDAPSGAPERELDDEGPIGRIEAYRIGISLTAAVYDDARAVGSDAALAQIAPQLVRAVGSIVCNIAEGYPRGSRADRIRYYEYSLGSVGEARNWYRAAERVLDPEVISSRLKSLASLRRLLLAMIRNERTGKSWSPPKPRGS